MEMKVIKLLLLQILLFQSSNSLVYFYLLTVDEMCSVSHFLFCIFSSKILYLLYLRRILRLFQVTAHRLFGMIDFY